VSVIVSGVPIGASLTHATDLGSGQWSIDVAQLGSIEYVPQNNWSGDVALSVTVTSREIISGINSSTTSTINIHVEDQADMPTIGSSNETGLNNAPIQLHLTAALTDIDGSEQLSIVVSGIPDDFTLSHGLNNGDHTWTLSQSDLNNLFLSAPTDFSGDVNLTATAYATEIDNGDTAASAVSNFTVHIDDYQGP